VPWIVEHGAEAYAALGTSTSHGTKAVCLNAGFAQPGIVEVELGTPLRAVIEEDGGGGRDGALEAVLIGGPMGSVLVPEEWDVPIGYDEMAARDVVLGHAGIVAVPQGTDWRGLVLHWLAFVQHESCGRCVPCRLGSRHAHALAERGDRAALAPLLETISAASLCAFGQLAVQPVAQMIRRFGDRIFRDDAHG
jgi:NADH:ubiquinone oxidoreductase subunit F (NADH-binding)